MKYWIVPSNDSIFRLCDAIKAQDGMADWRTKQFAKGDIVFVYKANPERCIRYKMEVVEVNLDDSTAFHQESFWADKDIFYQGMFDKYARLKFIEEYTDDIFPLELLFSNGFRGDINSVKEVNNQDLLYFLLHPQKRDLNTFSEVDYSINDDSLYEGALMEVRTNRYERNQHAREECISLKGCKCSVCGFDFEKKYGEIGKGFIHVHHVVPISSIGKEYKLDVEKDLVPVCPNCHYMLHHKNPPYSVEELKQILDENN